MTWKVRGRSSSQTPEPASTPMPSATTSSITALRRAALRARAMRAHRLVRERDQHQRRRADDEQEDAEVEQERARHVQLAESGRSTCATCDVRNGCANSQAPAPVAAASSSPKPIQRTGRSARRSSTQRVPPAMYCRMSAIASAMPGDKAAAGQVVAAQQQVEREHADRRRTCQRMMHAGHEQCPSRGGRARSARCCCAGGSMLSRAGRKRRSSEKTASATDAEHGDLAQRIEAAEIDEDHVDDVGAAALADRRARRRTATIVSRQRPRHHRVGKRREAAARGHGDREIAQPARQRGARAGPASSDTARASAASAARAASTPS